MPTYEYFCPACENIFEVVAPVSAHTTRSNCLKCGSMCNQTFTRVAVHDDHPAWINDAVRNQICGDNDPPVYSRTEYNRLMKRKGYVETDRRK